MDVDPEQASVRLAGVVPQVVVVVVPVDGDWARLHQCRMVSLSLVVTQRPTPNVLVRLQDGGTERVGWVKQPIDPWVSGDLIEPEPRLSDRGLVAAKGERGVRASKAILD
jgi:hypothetical protein